MFTNRFKSKFILALSICIIGGCAKLDHLDTALSKLLSPVDRIISRPDCKVVISGDEGENLSMSKLTCVKESATLSIELQPDSKVSIDERYETRYAPFLPFFKRTSHQDFTTSYVKSSRGFVIFEQDGSPWVELVPSEDLKKATLTFLSSTAKAIFGKDTLELAIHSCGE